MSTTSLGRREFVASGLTLTGAWLLSGCTPDTLVAPRPAPTRVPDTPVRAAAADDGDLFEPTVIRSAGGLLTASIAATTHPVTIAGRTVREPVTYGDAFPGPTLWVRPGDVVSLAFANRIVADQAETKPGYGRPPRHANATNLHFHGLHVPPTGTADNMTVVVPPNGSWRYLFQIPADHPAGLFWYHAHVHGTVTNHVSRGAAGMLYVANAYTDAIDRLGIRRRLMLLQQAYLDADLQTMTYDDGERENPERALSLINGQLLPEIHTRSGEPQVWSLLNGSSSAFYMLRLEGHTFEVVADDGVPLRTARPPSETLLLASGKRLEVVVRAGAAGRYTLSYDAFNQGVDTWPQRTIGTVVVDGERWTGPDHPGVDTSVFLEDLSQVRVPRNRRRTIVLATNLDVEEGVFGRFTMNGHPWDPTVNEWTSTLDTVEEWQIVNETDQDHPFHVHVNPFQITRVNGQAVPFDGYQDTAIVPRFGSLTVRTRFADFAGGPVLMHCHILDHEDMGMMSAFTIAASDDAA